MSQRRGAGGGPSRKKAASHQHLKPVADAHEQSAAFVKSTHGVSKHGPDASGQDSARAQVIAVRESAGNRQDLETIEFTRCLDQAIDVPCFDHGPGSFPRMGRFLVAIGSRSTNDQRRGRAMVFALVNGEEERQRSHRDQGQYGSPGP